MSSVNIVTIGTNISRPQNAEYLRVCISNCDTCKKKIPLNANLHPWYDCLLANQIYYSNKFKIGLVLIYLICLILLYLYLASFESMN